MAKRQKVLPPIALEENVVYQVTWCHKASVEDLNTYDIEARDQDQYDETCEQMRADDEIDHSGTLPSLYSTKAKANAAAYDTFRDLYEEYELGDHADDIEINLAGEKCHKTAFDFFKEAALAEMGDDAKKIGSASMEVLMTEEWEKLDTSMKAPYEEKLSAFMKALVKESELLSWDWSWEEVSAEWKNQVIVHGSVHIKAISVL